MKRINILRNLMLGLMVAACASCSDFFEPENDATLRGKDYMGESSELYSGFLGIVTKVQAIGDKAIYLTDTRGELLEPTDNTPGELYSLYNYDDDLSGNSYADPAKYYDVIISCNDFMQKAKSYKDAHETSIDMEHYKGLISSALRIKTWVYLTLGKIYGQAAWIDDPMQSFIDFSNFEIKDLDGILDACQNLLSTGFDGVNGTYNMDWRAWLDPTGTDSEVTSVYEYWNMMVPQHFVLQAEISLWKGDYQNTVNVLLKEMNRVFALNRGSLSATKYMRAGSYGGSYGNWFTSANPESWITESAITYNYQYNQKNSLLKHFDTTGEYMLHASLAGVNRFRDPVYNPSIKADDEVTSEKRFTTFKEVVKDKEYAVQKYLGMGYKAGHTVAHDDVQIYIYHTSDLYFMLVEALNNLGKYEIADVLMNKGFAAAYGLTAKVTANSLWKNAGFTNDWGKDLTEEGSYRTYQDLGIRGVFEKQLGGREMWRAGNGKTDLEIKKHNDLEILKEALLEFPCEGKTYPIMLRIARRWNDYSMISRFVSEKYADPAKAAEVAGKIEAGAYFVPWDLSKTASSH